MAAKHHRLTRQASSSPEKPSICRRRHEPSLVVQTTQPPRSYLHRHTFLNATASANGSRVRGWVRQGWLHHGKVERGFCLMGVFLVFSFDFSFL
ncbi:hypothetical protein L484_007255 [Morus notabilis]|uniref:Uncharacterized protein n=1 Tax=Morus notabilis TaxID=981085 RepID=W9RC70_9ROSA|nr:hypothetical protein L484_007255 [Morus notabilis]